jgi:hypothetical protein
VRVYDLRAVAQTASALQLQATNRLGRGEKERGCCDGERKFLRLCISYCGETERLKGSRLYLVSWGQRKIFSQGLAKLQDSRGELLGLMKCTDIA